MRRTRDEGSALVMVIGTMAVLGIVVSVAWGSAMQTVGTVRNTRDWSQALAAAEAGVDDYLARLHRNSNYWRTPDCTNVAMRRALPVTPPASAPPCGWDSSTSPGWLSVPGSARAMFHYEPSIETTRANGTIVLESTGRAGTLTRTVTVTLRRGGFGEYLYYTVYETLDPADEVNFGLDNAEAMDKCAHYFWEPKIEGVSKPRDYSGAKPCVDIQFANGDKIKGPMHSNDSILMSGKPEFQGTVTTSWPACKKVPYDARNCYRRATTTTEPSFVKGTAYLKEIALPDSIGDLKQHVDPTQTTTPGCRYTGPTRVVLNDNPAGEASTMTVWSPWSQTLNPGCGTPGPNAWPQTLPIPNNNIVVVEKIPAGSGPLAGPCSVGSIGGFPQSEDYHQTLREADCREGTLYLQGTLKGRITFSADSNILVTGNLTYSGGKDGLDALGLIAENSVKIYHPVKRKCEETNKSNRCTRYSYTNLNRPSGGIFENATVHASVLALKHSFTVQGYQYGGYLKNLHVYGSLAQKFRGPVGTSSPTGYTKDYEYDTRLRYAPPPFFLDPVGSSWGIKTFGESQARFRP
jgi:hypothetical protein